MAFLTKPKQIGKKRLWHAEIREGNVTVKSFSGYSTKRQLELAASSLLRKIQTGSILNAKMTLPELYRKWYELKVEHSGRKQATLFKYEQYEKMIFVYLNFPLNSITPTLYQKQLNKIGKFYNKGFLGLLTNCVRKSIEMAKLEKILVDDFTLGVEYFSDRVGQPEDEKYLHSIDDYEKVLNFLKSGLNYKASVVTYYLYLLFQTGMRPGELLAATWDDVNFDKQTIYTYRRVNSTTAQFTSPKTSNSVRYVPFNQNSLEVLKELKESQEVCNRELNIKNGNKFLFQHPAYLREIPSGAACTKVLRQVLGQLEIEPLISLYGCRHTRASFLLLKGVPVDVVAKVLGHTVAELLRTYRHLFREMENRGFAQIQNL